ncbi:hypothetical protein QTP88_019009 [Uroleucon formosanum]
MGGRIDTQTHTHTNAKLKSRTPRSQCILKKYSTRYNNNNKNSAEKHYFLLRSRILKVRGNYSWAECWARSVGEARRRRTNGTGGATTVRGGVEAWSGMKSVAVVEVTRGLMMTK